MSATIAIPATPFAFPFAPGRTALVVIDMQRDFVEPGGFGASLGNDVRRLHSAIAPIAALLAAWRARGWPIVHTREAHRPDLSDCPPAKRQRGNPRLRIGDAGPDGPHADRRRAGRRHHPGAGAAAPARSSIDKPGKGMFCATGAARDAAARGITHLVFTGVTTEVCVQTTMREANDRGYDCLLRRRRHRELLPRVQGRGARDDRARRARSSAGTHRRGACSPRSADPFGSDRCIQTPCATVCR